MEAMACCGGGGRRRGQGQWERGDNSSRALTCPVIQDCDECMCVWGGGELFAKISEGNGLPGAVQGWIGGIIGCMAQGMKLSCRQLGGHSRPA